MSLSRVSSLFPLRLAQNIKSVLTYVVTMCLCGGFAHAQFMPGNSTPDAAFTHLNYSQMYLDEDNRRKQSDAGQQKQRKQLVDNGMVSALDLDAPNKAIEEFNRASNLLKAQNSKEAIIHLNKALAVYPNFVSAHNSLGLAYLDQDDPRAKDEFETAARLDDKFPGSFLNLGMLALGAKDFITAQTSLARAAALTPKDAHALYALAYALNATHQYQEALQMVGRVHSLEHRGMANVHYLAASSALALSDFDTSQRELTTFLSEDPTNAMAPVARKNLDALSQRRNLAAQNASPTGQQPTALGSPALQTFPNNERLAAELNAVKEESGTEAAPVDASASTVAGNGGSLSPDPFSVATRAGNAFTIRKVVDETALFFAVSSHGKMVSDLELSNIQITDNDNPPQKVVLFVPQSKLPLRLGFVIDTSGSVQGRFAFEKRAATKFLEKILNGTSDLGFVGGFSSETTITQDFTAKPEELGKGIEKLANGGGTALFDAVSLACWKLAAYPEQERVAKVLVVLSDGEDNSSHRSLKQTIQDAEVAGVTIYTLSTREDSGPKSDADRILAVLAERSGGEAMFPGDILTLGKSLERLRELIRSRYLIAYKAADFEPNGKYRTVHITAERGGQKMQVHARKGYFARVEAPPQHN